jgi:hypothetical protein
VGVRARRVVERRAQRGAAAGADRRVAVSGSCDESEQEQDGAVRR